jgi:hypothetical protein
MSVDRRHFLSGAALAAAGLKVLPKTWALAAENRAVAGDAGAKAYGSGYFGNWMEDEFGLPAFRYTCDQINDPKAVRRSTFIKLGMIALWPLLPTTGMSGCGRTKARRSS